MLFANATTVARYSGTGLILVVTVYLVAMNWGCVIVTEINRRKKIDRHHSTVPLVSLFLAGCAYFVFPSSGRIWVFVVPLCDIANWLVLLLPFWLIKEAWQKKQSHLIANESVQSEPLTPDC